MNPRSPRLLLALSVLLATTLACSLSERPISRQLQFKSVTATPAESDGSTLNLEVVYAAVGTTDKVWVTCYYQSGSGPVEVGGSEALGSIEARTSTMDFPFRLSQPGAYQAWCSSSDGARSGFASFQVTPPAAADDGQMGGILLPKMGGFSSAGMWFYFDSATSSVPGFFIQHGLPGVNYNDQGGFDFFKIAADGTFTGECRFAYGTATILTGKIAEGRWTEDGKVTFRLETQAVMNSQNADHPGTATESIVWLASGQFTELTYAKGTAEWNGTCSTTNPEWAPCAKPELGSNVQASGTIQWVIEFRP